MHAATRPVVLVLAALAVGWSGWSRDPVPGAASTGLVNAAVSAEEHELARLRVVHEALAPVFETYVEPERVDPERMYRAALDAVERLVPTVLLVREDSRVVARIGRHVETLDVPPVRDARVLERELRRIATLLAAHLEPDDVPSPSGGLDAFAAVEFAMGNGILATLDPHSAMLPPEESRELDDDNQGRFGGLGVDIRVVDDRLLVEGVLAGRPAARAGVLPGDHVRRIDGQSTLNLSLDEAVRLLRGEVGAPVVLEVVRANGERVDEVTVVRDVIPIHVVEGAVLPERIGYVRIPSFHATTHEDLVVAVADLEARSGGLRGLVLDLRGNPGGYLREAVAVADAFLAEGDIVATRGPYDRRPNVETARAGDAEPSWPMVVLVDAASASASEIVAGALRNHDRAVVVGARTFGKGSVQNLHPLPFSGKLKLTVAHYLTPGERSIQGVGVPADVEVAPVWVGARGRSGGAAAEVALYAGERVQRESSLASHLDRPDERAEEGPFYRVTPLRRPDDPPLPSEGAPDLARDVDLRLAHAVVHAAPSARRGDVLAAVGPLLRREAVAHDREVASALAELGLDWSPGPALAGLVVPSAPTALEARLRVGGGGSAPSARAGVEEPWSVEVVNTGAQPLHRLVAIVSGPPWIDGVEFPIGYLAPGASRTWTRPVRVDDGVGPRVDPVRIEVRDGGGRVVATSEVSVATVATAPPRLTWRWAVEEPEDGTLDLGDTARLRVTVTNVGEGEAAAAVVRLRHRAGPALDVGNATLRVGTPLDAAGRVCVPTLPGWEAGAVVGAARPEHAARLAARLPPVWPDACRRVLPPGGSWSGVIEARLVAPRDDGYPVELSVADEAALRHGEDSVVAPYLVQRESLVLALGAPGPGSGTREPPRVELAAALPTSAADGRVSVVGRVTDEGGVDHVAVWVDDDKVALEAGGQTPVGALPFAVDLALEPGVHRVRVVARDLDGYVTTVAHTVFREGAPDAP